MRSGSHLSKEGSTYTGVVKPQLPDTLGVNTNFTSLLHTQASG